MKHRIVIGFALVFLLTAFSGDRTDLYPAVKNESFSRGEVLKFKMTYGIFTVGRGSASIHPNYHKVHNRDCYKVDVFAETVGMVNWVTDVKDQWGAYVDTTALLPEMFYRRQREGNYKKDEQTYFDHKNRKISVRTIDKETNQWKEPLWYDAPPHVRDMISGFLYMRIMDLSSVKVNDTIKVSGFFEDEFYNLRVIYKGKDLIRTKVGRVRTVVFKPVMPRNKLFDGENSITVHFSDDKNRIPIKISAEMFIGSAGVELTDYSGLRNPLSIVH